MFIPGEGKMIKKLSKHGNSYALVIDKAILELLNITPDTELKIRTDGESIIIEPVHIGQIADAIMDEYEEAFKRLAK